MNLIIVESPTKTKTINKYLKSGFKTIATMGHIRDLPKKKLGVDVNNNYKPTYVQDPKKRQTVVKLKKEAKKAQKIYLATDPDREGEAIAYHAKIICNDSGTGHFYRITFHEITKSAIEKALKNPGKIDMQLVDAQQARRILDRLVGYKLSPLLWRKIRRGLSAGRVQSVALRLIVDREREIEKFIPEEYWNIACRLRKRIGKKRPDLPTFEAKLSKKNGQKIKPKNEKQANQVVAELEKAEFEVEKVKKKERKRNPRPPYITSTLQRSAFFRLGYSSKYTMRLAQGLYEKGLITYHRTDSVALAKEALGKIRQFINDKYSYRYLTKKPRIFKTRSKVAQEAHEAIRPTSIVEADRLKFSSQSERKVYELIFKRAVASQMKTSVYDQTRIYVRATGESNVYSLFTKGEVMKFPGWQIVYQREKKQDDSVQLPEVTRGDELSLVKVLSEQKFTQPPPRYSEATLIKTLEKEGIGRPSTYVPIISTLKDRHYVELVEKKFKPTALGKTVNDFLVEYFPKVVDYDFTAKMEDKLDKIAQGEKEWVSVVDEFYQPFHKHLESVGQVAERVSVPTEATGEECPKCGEGQLVVRIGKYGKFLSCSRFPDCDYSASYVEKLEGFKCPECGGDVVIKKTRKGKKFYGCSNYPKCDWASWKDPRGKEE